MKWELDGVDVECVQGDITSQDDIDAVVNAANAELMPGGGVAGAIHRKAGLELEAACQPLAPIEPGEAVITKAFGLPNEYIIHCLGPIYGVDKPEDKLLESCYTKALELAEKNQLDSIAFPAISTGAFAYPFEEAISIAIPTVISNAAAIPSLNSVRFVLFSKKDLEDYEGFIEKFYKT